MYDWTTEPDEDVQRSMIWFGGTVAVLTGAVIVALLLVMALNGG
jgi:hypothetical protein